MLNLAVIEPGSYFAQGSYGFSETGLRVPLQCQLKIEAFPNALTIEGRARHSAGGVFGFRVEFTRDPTSQSQADALINVANLVTVRGRVALLGPTIELLAYDLTQNTVLSARIVPLEKERIFESSGFVSLKGTAWFPFHFRVTQTAEAEALENVVGIHTGKRA